MSNKTMQNPKRKDMTETEVMSYPYYYIIGFKGLGIGSPVTCHLLPVTCYLSPVTCHLLPEYRFVLRRICLPCKVICGKAFCSRAAARR